MAEEQQILMIILTVTQRILPTPTHFAVFRLRQPGQNAQQAGLARAVRPFHLNNLARLHRKA
ncbi:hypothetical protein D3C80_1980410 [compost metagenome]